MADELDKIKNILDGDKSNVNFQYNNATSGLNMDQSVNQIPKGSLTYALNANMENFDASSVNYQNEPGNEFCVQFPTDYILIGSHFIQEKNKHIFFITNPITQNSQIGYMDNNDCIYQIFISAPCLNFNINYPILKTVHKITNCTTELYWTDGLNSRRYLDLNPETIPYILEVGSLECSPIYTDEIDCNQLKLQPNFNIPNIDVFDVVSGGNLTAGTVQFAIQYADASGNPYTSYYSVTNPTPIADIQITTPNFNYNVGKSVILKISNLDSTGQFQYYNMAVIKTVNNVSSVELVGTYFINNPIERLTYTGQNETNIRLAITDIFEKQPYYEIANDLTSVQDILVWSDLTTVSKVNYQSIANKILLNWESWRIPSTENYSDEVNATNLRGYLRDEIYPFEICFLLQNGKQTDGFHIPGREKNANEAYRDVPTTNDDFIGNPDSYNIDGTIGYSPYWKIYNTGSVTGNSTGFTNANSYKGPYQYGQFAYWESEDLYPCVEEIWGDLAGKPIRHHKFPDTLVSPIFEEKIFYSKTSMEMGSTAVFPIGVKIDVQEIAILINSSNLTTEQKNDIVGFKILRGDRGTNKSIIGKGILRNVGEYKREEQSFYFPNYPYNDISDDPFLLTSNNAFTCFPWIVMIFGTSTVAFTNCERAFQETKILKNNPESPDFVNGSTVYEFCSATKPTIVEGTKGNVCPADFDVIRIPWYRTEANLTVAYLNPLTSDNSDVKYTLAYIPGTNEIGCEGGNTYVIVKPGALVYKANTDEVIWYADRMPSDTLPPNKLPAFDIINDQDPYNSNFCAKGMFSHGRRTEINCAETISLNANKNEKTKYRQVFNSPETSFGQPFLGNVLKLENVIYGTGNDHFIKVKDNAKYRLLSREAQIDALNSCFALGITSVNSTAVFTAYQSYLTIYVNGITRKNYAYSYNSRADYNYKANIDNNFGIKQREIDISTYLIPGVQNVGDDKNINNYQRESSVFIKTIETRKINNNPSFVVKSLLFPSDVPDMLNSTGEPQVTDKSRTTISASSRCNTPAREDPIQVVSYYASLKNVIPNQWGQIYTYKTIDTGFQRINFKNSSEISTIFGGDTFISRFAFKTKLPFFIDNRVNAPDDSDVFYDEIGNIAYPKYWHSARSILETYATQMTNIISTKAHNFDCPNNPALIVGQTGIAGTYRTYYDGYFYLFAYGIPNFYCETSYNLDLRQAFNNKEGDFWPHVSTGIPDDWVQESFVSIANDNTYTYNVTFSKQNTENNFTHLPPDYKDQLCLTNYPFRTIYSDPQVTNSDNRVNNWLVYKPLSFFDFPQNYGKLISLDGIQNKAVLARFENKTLLYNNLLTVDTSNPQAAYFGNSKLFDNQYPPIDFAETDLGYVGTQNKMLLKIPQGQITVDAKRGQVFLVEGTKVEDLSAFGSGMNRFFTDHLAFEILRYFPKTPTDNNFTGIGLHGVYDSKFDRVILTKLDYIPIDKDVKYDADKNEYYIETITYIDAATTTTTTSTSSTTTTSTTDFVSREFCAWSTDVYAYPTLTSEYNPIDNTLTAVPVENDLLGLVTVGIASTSTKFWKHNPMTRTIREWWINSYPASLTYNRDIIYGSNSPNFVVSSVIVAVDNTTIITTLNSTSLIYPNGVPGSVFLWKYDISSINPGFGTSMFAIQAGHYAASMILTTDSKLIVVASRIILNVNVFYLTQYSYPGGLLEVDISLASIPLNPSASILGFYIITFNQEIYLVRTSDSSLFKVGLTYPYTITEVTDNLGWSQTTVFESSTGECNNVSFAPLFPECGQTLPVLGGNFTYFGNTVTNTAWSGGILSYALPNAGFYNPCTGLWTAPFHLVFNGPPFSYTLTFSNPVNNIGIIISILDFGDNFTITTNEEVPSVAASTVCYAHTSGNQIITDMPPTPGLSGSGRFVITTATDFTVLTIQGTNGGNGGYITLDCDPNAPIPTTTTTTSTTLAPTGFNTIYTHFEAI